MSAIVEIKVPMERTEEIILLVWDVEKGAGQCAGARRRNPLRLLAFQRNVVDELGIPGLKRGDPVSWGIPPSASAA